MRGHVGPCLVPGNAIAARRLARRKKPPPIILWSIGIITCLLLLGAAALLTVGYLNPFGTVGLSILGVGAVVYFGAIIFLVLTCLWVERKYPGMQPLSFRFYSRKPQRPPPTAFVNPNFSGQAPQETPSYRIHNEVPSNIPSVSNAEEPSVNVPAGPGAPTQNKNDKPNGGNNQPEQMLSLDKDKPSHSLQDEGSKEVTNDPVHEDITISEAKNQEEGTSANASGNIAIKETLNAPSDNAKANVIQNENISKNGQKEYYLEKESSAQKEGKTQPKMQHVDLPTEDYHSRETSFPSTSNMKESAPEKQGSNPTQQSRKTLEINPSHIAMAPSLPTSQEEKATTPQKIETQKDVAPTRKEQSVEKQSQFLQQTQFNTSQTVNTETDGLFKKNQNAKEISQTDNNIHRRTAIRVHNQKKEAQSQNIQDISRLKTMGLTPTDTTLLDDGRKPKKQDSGLQHSNSGKNNDSAVLTKTSVNDRKRVQFQEYHAPSVQPSADAKNALQYNNDNRHGHQNKSLTNAVSASTNHFAQNPDFKGALPGLAKKMEIPKKPKKVESPERLKKYDSPERTRIPELPAKAKKQESPERLRKPESPERGRKLRLDPKLSHSPPNVRKIVSSSSPTRRHQNISPRASRDKDNVLAKTNKSSSKEEFYRRQNYYALLSSQSSDLPTSTSSSPPRHHKASPDLSRKHQIHASKSAELHSSASKERKHDNLSQQSSPSSYSSDVTSSTSSSPQRRRRKDPDDISHKAQIQKGNPTVNAVFPSNTKKEDLDKRLSQQSSQSKDVTSSPDLSATRVLEYKLEHVDLNNSTRYPHTIEPLIQSFYTTGEDKQQTKHQHLDKPRTSPHSRDLSPAAARTSAPSIKRLQTNPRQDQT